MHKKISVVLPSYNEKENVEEIIDRISKALGNDLLEIIIVDDNSPDGTWKIVENLNNPKVNLIRRMNERGLASALFTGIHNVKGDYIVWMDCDLGLPPENIPGLVKQLSSYDIAIASRYVPGGGDPRPLIRSFLSVILNNFSGLFLGFDVKDYTSGFAAVKKEVFSNVKFKPVGFGEYFIEFIYKAKKKNYKIVEIPIVYQLRKGGISKSDGNIKTFIKLGWDYGIKIISLRFKT